MLTSQDSLVAAIYNYSVHGIYNLQVTKHNQCKKGEESAKNIWGVAGEQLAGPQTNLDKTTYCKS